MQHTTTDGRGLGVVVGVTEGVDTRQTNYAAQTDVALVLLLVSLKVFTHPKLTMQHRWMWP